MIPSAAAPDAEPMTAALARSLVPAALALLLAACWVPPKPERPKLRDEAPLAGLAAPGGGAWPDPQWWKRYDDSQLDALERRALAAAPSLDEAHRRFTTAVRAVETARATGVASLELNAQLQRQRLSDNGLIPPQLLGFHWYNQGDLGLQFQYAFDFWGKRRAAIAAAVDAAHAADAERSAAALMLTSAVADTYFGWQADQARLALAGARVAAFERRRLLAVRRVARGIDAPDALRQAEAQVAAARELQAVYAGSVPLRAAALAALLGVAPADLPTLATRPLPTIERRLPDDVGLDLLARRPDIAASRWQVEAAMQRVTQARAEFYPDISLGAMAGLSSIDLGKWLAPGSRVFTFGPALHLPVFELARLRAAYGASQAQLEAAAAQYDSAVVAAAHDVATQALTFEQVAARRRQREAQLAAAQALHDTTAARVRRGLDDERSLLATQAQVLEQQDAEATLLAQAISTEIALTRALGGGYRMTTPARAEAGAAAAAARSPTPPSPAHPTSEFR